MKILITGSKGQLGKQLIKECKKRKICYVAYDISEFDITDKEASLLVVDREKPSVIINCAALTDVDGCEKNETLAFKVNALGPKFLAEISLEKNIALVHLSTDYVFDGNGNIENGKLRPYIETDITNPKTVYGKSKEAGENFVRAIASRYFIVRSAWLYGDGKNFVQTILNLGKKGKNITVVNDQVGSPTSTVDLARAIIELIHTESYGLYHGTCEGECSWYDFALEIFKQIGLDIEVMPISTAEYKNFTPRPHYSVLENKALKNLNINTFREWKVSLKEYIDELKENTKFDD